MKVDDIKVGQTLAITCHKVEAAPISPFMFDSRTEHEALDTSDYGIPFEVLAINLPFLVIRMHGKNRVIDCRAYGFCKISRAYVNALNGKKRKAKQKAKGTVTGVCPRCGNKPVQRWTDAGWLRYCNECSAVVEEVKTKQ